MEFNSNTYNSIQNFGTDYYLGRAGNIVQSSSTNTAWQVGACNNSTGNTNVFIRTGNLCLVPQTNASLSLLPCTSSHVSWQLSYANGRSVGDGLYLRNTEVSGTRYLSSDLGPPPIILMAIKPAVNAAVPEFAWGFREIPRSNWPDNGPLSVDFCPSVMSTTSSVSPMSSMPQGSSTVLPVTSSITRSGVASTASTVSPTSAVSTASSASSSSPTTTARSSVVTSTQQSSSSAPVATPSSDVNHLTMSKSLLLAMIGVSVYLQVI